MPLFVKHGPPMYVRALLAAAVLALALAPVPAAAHTKVTRTQPAHGDTVATTLAEVRLVFSAGVEPGLTTVTLLRDGRPVVAGSRVVEGSENREYLLALTEPLAPGAYVARWRTAGGDGHVLEGGFRFTVAASSADSVAAGLVPTRSPEVAAAAAANEATAPPGPPATEARSAAAEPLPVAVRWLWFTSLLGMIGVVAFRFGVLGRLGREGTHRVVAGRAEVGLWIIALGAASLSVLTLFARLWLQAAALGMDGAWSGEQMDLLLTRTGWGLAWVLQAIATLAFAGGMLISRAPHGRAAGWMGAAGGAVLLSAVPPLSGHAAAVPGRAAMAIFIDTVHVLGAGVWLGSLAMLLAVGVPAALTAGRVESGPAVAAMVRLFSPMALVAASAVAVTGIINTLLHLTAPADLWATGYGRALVIKLALLAGVAAVGWHNWRRVLPTLGDDAGTGRLRRSARAELAIAAAVLLLTAVLVALPTP